MRRLRHITLVVFLIATARANALAQTGPCLSQPDSTELFLEATRHVFEYSDSTAMVSLGIPWTRMSNVAPVTDSLTCSSAVTAFNAAAGIAGTPNAEVAAYVFSLGGAGFAYVRPGDGTDFGLRPVYFFSLSWVFKGTIMS